jgi:hypothetical protein
MVINATTAMRPDIEGHIRTILKQLEKKPERFGIGEADPDSAEIEWYPPNAYHTYWTLEILYWLERRFPADFARLSPTSELDLARRRDAMVLWSRQQLGYQIGLHSAVPASSVLDSDQLAWSLTVFLRFDKNFAVNLENRDFIKQAFKCLFSTQTDGAWRHYKPLFHYKEAGNAYCYVFETFAALLQCVLQDGAEAEMIREVLKPYCVNLLDLWRYADSTKIPLVPERKQFGWCSGHRTNVTAPESWATASVFSYAQSLRRLLGIWCRDDAYHSLNSVRSRLGPEDAANEISSIGKTWDETKSSVSQKLWTMFINPVRLHDCIDKLEPDSQPIEEKYARSAILFGPPGTGKTTLVRSLADVIEWKYIEIHASHFVAEGLTQVQKTADKLFKRLLELDHSVVLFDEIDELVRERDIEKDAFGRFLTTSMLPKLAELWEARRILYFVATNHINYFDSAIIRSHRFDALILVSPPAFTSKVAKLESLLSQSYNVAAIFKVTEQQIQAKLDDLVTKGYPLDATWRDQQLSPDFALAKFALLRWDELNELAYHLALLLKGQSPATNTITEQILQNALTQVADSEWRKNKSYSDYLRDTHSERRDYQMRNVWEIKGSPTITLPGEFTVKNQRWLVSTADSLKDTKVPGVTLSFGVPGRVEIRT